MSTDTPTPPDDQDGAPENMVPPFGDAVPAEPIEPPRYRGPGGAPGYATEPVQVDDDDR